MNRQQTIRRKIAEKKLTRKAFQAALGHSNGTVQKILTGVRVSDRIMFRVCEVLDLDPKQFIN